MPTVFFSSIFMSASLIVELRARFALLCSLLLDYRKIPRPMVLDELFLGILLASGVSLLFLGLWTMLELFYQTRS